MAHSSPATRLLDGLRLEASGVPIYVQVREQVLQALAAGGLQRGDQMPTLRQVAVALKIDINTVRRAYDALERAGAISIRHGRGAFVEGPPAPPAPPDPKTAADALDGLARQTLAAARALGFAPDALVRRLVELSHPKGPER
jgi:GntR family transcriptional regulator